MVNSSATAVHQRDGNKLAVVSYTRGKDLSGSLEGAGGIGGLLARTDMPSTINPELSTAPHAYYHCDGNGNVTALVGTNQLLVARYLYGPYGQTLSASGPLAEANVYRFSSKEWHPNSGLVYYLYRFYDGSLQRWVNRDPIMEDGGLNLYGFVGNNPVNWIDPLGLKGAEDLCEKPDPDKTARKVLKQCNYHSKKENREYCGMICRDNRSGRIFKTGPITGTGDSCAPHNAPCPSGSTHVAIYHTHGEFTDRNGDGIDDYDSENFSPADRRYAGRFGVPIYLRTPSCQFKKYDPATGNTTILLPL